MYACLYRKIREGGGGNRENGQLKVLGSNTTKIKWRERERERERLQKGLKSHLD